MFGIHFFLLTIGELASKLVFEPLEQANHVTRLSFVGVGFRCLVIHAWFVLHEITSHHTNESRNHGLCALGQRIPSSKLQQDCACRTWDVMILCHEDRDGTIKSIKTLAIVGRLLDESLVILHSLNLLGLLFGLVARHICLQLRNLLTESFRLVCELPDFCGEHFDGICTLSDRIFQCGNFALTPSVELCESNFLVLLFLLSFRRHVTQHLNDLLHTCDRLGIFITRNCGELSDRARNQQRCEKYTAGH
mmetsp:Transcript_49905/g.78974  ORF Transcript_49905/g.78974 Transcript_49905/m.78974 type:complete len:249 (+) Transcript_49905:1421-2167(+)